MDAISTVKPHQTALQHITLDWPLHEYQKVDIDKACNSKTYGFYWFMGAGKTVSAAVVGTHKLLNGFETCIILCPASMVSQWKKTLVDLNLVTCAYQGTPVKRKKLDIDVDMLVMSYQIFLKDFDRFKDLKDIFWIIDEAVCLRAIDNKIFKSLRGGVRTVKTKTKLDSGLVMETARKIHYPRIMDDCLLLTGTPIGSNILGAYGLISITNPKAYNNFYRFQREHVALEDTFGKPLKYKNLELLHDNLVTNASLLVVEDHLDLPDKVYNIIHYDLTPVHQKLYKRLVTEQLFELEDGSILDGTEANRLYHLCQQFIFCPPDYKGKVEGLEILDSLVADTEQRIIFSNYRASNDQLMGRYDAGGAYGNVTRKKQEHYVSEFKSGILKTLVANPRSAGSGLNLQICNQAIFAEFPIVNTDFRQAEARVWRQGQENRVVITILVARRTIQEMLLRRVLEKDEVSAEVLHSKSNLKKDLMGIEC